MTDDPIACPRHDTLVALALGDVTGRERAVLVEHLARCRSCRAQVDDLMDTADRLLLVTPEAEPPAGFEAAVLGRVGHERSAAEASQTSQASPRRTPWLVAIAACVAALATLTTAAMVVDRSPTSASASMVTPGGYVVGTVWAHHGDPGLIVVSVPNWRMWDDDDEPPDNLQLEVELVGGDTAALGVINFNDADGSWGTTTTLDTDRITGVSIVDSTGRIWCSATL